ncbi:MAG: antibiotic biosynthesis monooxygenase [Myxococcales bacterium]|nr:antibiotic biosynthesis monooxygenase [Myxococcales bacterium]
MIAATPAPPYVAVIFSSHRSDDDAAGYAAMANEMERQAATQPGYLGIESARGSDGFGVTVSYWRDAACARTWKAVADHLGAQRLGRERWYRAYRVRVAEVTREYGFDRDSMV